MPDAIAKLFEAAPKILSIGFTGFGFLLVVVAAYVFISSKGTQDVNKFLIFAVAFGIIGALSEFNRTRDESQRFYFTALLPAEVFNDYVNWRTLQIFSDRPRGPERFDKYLSVDQKANLKLFIKAGKCKKYFLTSVPPALVEGRVLNSDLPWKEIENKGYYQEGMICAPADTKNGQVAEIEVTIKRFDSFYSFRTWEATEKDLYEIDIIPTASAAVKKAAPPFSKRVCTGEYKDSCPGAYDIFIPCPNHTNDEIVKFVCTLQQGRVIPLATGISGHQCGYSLLQVDCS